MNTLERCRELLDLSRQMPPLARAERWDELAGLQARRVALIASLPPALSPAPGQPAELLRSILLDIQTCDREVMEFLLPQHTHIAKLLAAQPLPASTP